MKEGSIRKEGREEGRNQCRGGSSTCRTDHSSSQTRLGVVGIYKERKEGRLENCRSVLLPSPALHCPSLPEGREGRKGGPREKEERQEKKGTLRQHEKV